MRTVTPARARRLEVDHVVAGAEGAREPQARTGGEGLRGEGRAVGEDRFGVPDARGDLPGRGVVIPFHRKARGVERQAARTVPREKSVENHYFHALTSLAGTL